MKKLLALIVLLCSIQVALATTYHATTNGNDTTGNGTTNPYRSLYKCSTVALEVGDSIILGTGTFYNTRACFISTGVSVRGAGQTLTIINCSNNSSNIVFESATVINGNQSISNLKLDGNNIGYGGIYSRNRHSVTIKNCYIQNFTTFGIYIANPGTDLIPLVSGCVIKYNTLINCSRYYAPGSGGALWVTGQRNISIRRNLVYNPFVTGDSTGFAFKCSSLQNALIDSNSFKIIGHNDQVKWAFAIESNNNLGGVEFAADTVQGTFDIAGRNSLKQTYTFSVSVHNCIIGYPTLTTYQQQGILLEANVSISDVYIYNNYIQNLCYAFRLTPQYANSITQRIYVHNNLFRGIGQVGVNNGYAVYSVGSMPSAIVRDIYFDNNTIIAAEIANTQVTAFSLPTNCTVKNFRIRNNIIVGFENSPIMTYGGYLLGTIDSLYVQSNVFYQNGNTNDAKWWGEIPTNIISDNNVKANPLLVGNGSYSIQSGSPARNTGQDIGLTTDLVGRAIPQETIQDRGAYEYYFYTPWIIGTVTIDAPINITDHTILINATAALDGGGTISERGICYGVSANPTILGTKVTLGSGLGSFQYLFSYLGKRSTWHYRAYVTNEAGTAYSSDLSVTTDSSSSKLYNKGKIIMYKGKALTY